MRDVPGNPRGQICLVLHENIGKGIHVTHTQYGFDFMPHFIEKNPLTRGRMVNALSIVGPEGTVEFSLQADFQGGAVPEFAIFLV